MREWLQNIFGYSLSLLFICLFPLLSTYLFTLRGWTFPWVFSGKLITWAKYVTLAIFAKTLKAFRNFSLFFFCFHWKITWHLGKVNKKVKSERVRNWIDARFSCFGFTSFNVPSCLLPKTTNKLLLYNLYYFMWYQKTSVHRSAL